ncbi:CHASE2 domain-containing protein [Nostoc sp. ChiQUE01b]|uniref:CHASE2 domain-containing protein n=1 Tax=Nostoc sp. ChiQUE01b TaxID=3075376 RepID=UPI002AD25A6C|nr:CHASE2 domain-containing protein [Nostoc sp. ChiQUE01b]MDZ8263859.1 CHASE2 domain-containing protein [Nostoc sp. ChiQUE01b]
MSKLVVLELGEGDFGQQGFPVTLQIAEDGEPSSIKITGSLPAAPQLEQSYKDWQSSYSRYRRSGSPMRLEAADAEIINIGDFRDECQEAGRILSDTLNDWLKSNSFTDIREEFFQKIKSDEKIRILLQTDEHLLWKLPWSLWELLLQDYKYAEIALSPRKYEPPSEKYQIRKRKIKILAIIGNSQGINVAADQQILNQQLPDANIEFLVEPSRNQLNDKLWEQTWDILFFAGHSESQDDANQGWLKINKDETLSIQDLKFALDKAIAKGLSLAIFNSCDGLGLAAELSAMQIPQMIVMRESIPDEVAQEFLKHFLKAFARGQSLYLAVREARERLQGLEGKFPCASWLPVIFQNPASTPLTWIPRKYAPKFSTVMAASVAVAVLVLGVRYLGLLQPLELKAYDQMMQLRPDEEIDHRILVVEVTQKDIDAQDKKERGSSSLTVSTFTKLLNNIQKYKPHYIGLVQDLDTPEQVVFRKNLEKLFEENSNLYALCGGKNIAQGDVSGNPPSSKDAFGFSDVFKDGDQVLRRYVWYQNSQDTRCSTPYAFSLILALQYLEAKETKYQVTSKKQLQIGNVILPRLQKRAGGYQPLDNHGYQMLLNYRTSYGQLNKITDFTPVENFISSHPPSELANLVKDRIVIIGVTDKEFAKDNLFQTPYNQKITPVWVHAQMVSQILSAVQDKRPLLSVWSDWEDILWICGWSFVGGLIVWRIRGAIRIGVAIFVAIAILYSSCFLLFIQGLWVPFVPSVLVLITITGIFIVYIQYQEGKKFKV